MGKESSYHLNSSDRWRLENRLYMRGPEFSSIAGWVRELDVGLVLTQQNFKDVVQELLRIYQDPDMLASWQKNAIQTYQSYFAKKIIMDAWNSALHEELKHDFQTMSPKVSVISESHVRIRTHAGGSA